MRSNTRSASTCVASVCPDCTASDGSGRTEADPCTRMGCTVCDRALVSMRYFAVLPPDYLRPASTFWNHYRFGRDGLPVIFSSWRDTRTPGGDESNTQFGLKVWCALPRCGWRMFRAVRSSPGGVWTPELGYRARPFWTAPRRWPDPVCRFRTTASTWTHIDTRLKRETPSTFRPSQRLTRARVFRVSSDLLRDQIRCGTVALSSPLIRVGGPDCRRR